MVDQTRDRKPLFLAERRLFLPVDLGVQSPLSFRQVAQVDHAQDLDQALLAKVGVALANLLGVCTIQQIGEGDTPSKLERATHM